MGLAPGRALRKAVVTLVILGILCVALTAEAQQPTKVHRIGRLYPGSPTEPNPNLEAFRQGLRDLGYVEGQNLVIEARYAEGSEERLRDLAAELVRLKVDVIVPVGAAAIRAAQHATRTIPIVMAGTADPVGEGLVASLARPGGEHHGFELPERGTPREAAGDPRLSSSSTSRLPRPSASPFPRSSCSRRTRWSNKSHWLASPGPHQMCA